MTDRADVEMQKMLEILTALEPEQQAEFWMTNITDYEIEATMLRREISNYETPIEASMLDVIAKGLKRARALAASNVATAQLIEILLTQPDREVIIKF
jgi:hypothetical protein